MTHVVVRDRGRELSGVVRPGESWGTAATRICASLHVEPVPLDLSGKTKTFVVDHETRIALRAMTRDDLPHLVRWRSADHVRRWWDPQADITPAAIEAKYGPRIDGASPTRMWVIEANRRPIGFLQDYRIAEIPDYAALVPEPRAVGLDYAIGEVDSLGQGLGVRMLWAWAVRARRRFPDVERYLAAPDPDNVASVRALAKTGFMPGPTFDQPQEDGGTVRHLSCTLDVAAVVS